MKNNTEQSYQYDLSYLSPDTCHRCSRAFRPGNQRAFSHAWFWTTPRRGWWLLI